MDPRPQLRQILQICQLCGGRACWYAHSI